MTVTLNRPDTPTPQPSPPPTAELAQALTPVLTSVFTAIAAQAALIVGLLYFYGRVRTGAFYGYFGIPTRTFGFSTSDYVVGSLNAMIPPLVICALLVLGTVAFSHQLESAAAYLASHPARRRAAVATASLVVLGGVTVVLIGLSRLDLSVHFRGYKLPIALLAIAAAAAFARRIHQPPAMDKQPPHRLWIVTIAVFTLAGVLWFTNLYAAADGLKAASDRAATLRAPTTDDIVLFSAERLAISGNGIQVDELTKPDSRYKFQYSGLRLLIRTPDELVVLPATWEKGDDPVFVIPIDDVGRFDIIPH